MRNQKRVSQRRKKKPPKVFNKWQAALLLILTLLLSVGGGITYSNMYGDSNLDMKRVRDQLAFYEQQIQLNPNNLESRVAYAYTNYLLGNESDAIKELNWVLNQDPDYYNAHLNLGLINLNRGQYHDAMFSFNETIRLGPQDFKGYMNLGRVYIELEMFDEAMEKLTIANNLSQRNSDIIYYIGLLAERLGEYSMADEVYRDALRYNPMYERALEGLRRIEEKVAEEASVK
ncbi:MAG: tetratricopeptide repeat protein [Bacillus sp. (in: Bacteria)]|nr:tetratricopeptide repeat protein [Bacillus sp. (in: firmicutes)]